MAVFNPTLINARYIYDAFQLIKATPEKEDLSIGFAKLNVEYKKAGKEVPTDEAQREMLQFVGRADSYARIDGKGAKLTRFVYLAQIEDRGFDEFNKACQEFIQEDVSEGKAAR